MREGERAGGREIARERKIYIGGRESGREREI